MFERNKWRWRYDVIHNNGVRNNGNIMSVQYYCTVVIIRADSHKHKHAENSVKFGYVFF